jgi:low temperature requirement protein LtrA
MVMPLGTFLDSLPSTVFIIAHVVFLLVGLWAVKKTMDERRPYAAAFGLYVLTQVVFLGFFGDVLTMKMAVLLEQTLILVMVVWIASRK